MTDFCPKWPAVARSYTAAPGLDYKTIQLTPGSLFNEMYEGPLGVLESSRKKSYKMLVLVVLFAIIQGQIISSEVMELPTPRIRSISFHDPLQFTVYWNTVESRLKDEPVLGYKVHVWDTPYVPRVQYKELGGELVRIVETPRRRKLRLQKAHFNNSTNVIEGADTTSYTQENISLNVTYEVKVQVYTNTRDGPLSPPNRFTLH